MSAFHTFQTPLPITFKNLAKGADRLLNLFEVNKVRSCPTHGKSQRVSSSSKLVMSGNLDSVRLVGLALRVLNAEGAIDEKIQSR